MLIFDEVLSGFRTALGGVQAEYGVTPDLTTHAKALANGLPLSSVSGRADLMDLLAPTGTVVHSGTYSGHLLSMLAALATLEVLASRASTTASTRPRTSSTAICKAFSTAPDCRRGCKAWGPVRPLFGRSEPVRTWSDALSHDHALNAASSAAASIAASTSMATPAQGPPRPRRLLDRPHPGNPLRNPEHRGNRRQGDASGHEIVIDSTKAARVVPLPRAQGEGWGGGFLLKAKPS